MAWDSGSRTVFPHEQLLLLLNLRVGTCPGLDHQGTMRSGHSDGPTGPQVEFAAEAGVLSDKEWARAAGVPPATGWVDGLPRMGWQRRKSQLWR